MATRTHTKTIIAGGSAVKITWEGLLNGDSGDAIDLVEFADRSVQFVGTFGSGGTVLLEGSNDSTTYATLTDPQGNAILKTEAGIEAVSELTHKIRPRVTAGDGTTDIDVHLIARAL